MNNQLIEWRREFHKYAEPGWLEMRTASRIAKILTDFGYNPVVGKALFTQEPRMGVPSKDVLDAHYQWALENGGEQEFLPYTKEGYTAVMAELDCGEGPATLLRFDMDALGVKESKAQNHKPAREAFASVNDGVMHSCAHDGHMAIGLGVAKALQDIKNQLKGKIKILFQPAEEGVRGAKSLAHKGIIGDVQLALAAHIVPDGGTGVEAAFIEEGGQVGLATSKLDVVFHGKASHAGANPEEGNNAMLAAATAVLNLQAIPRYGKIPTQINVGTLHAGTGRNVVCDRAKLEMETRGGTSEADRFMKDYAVRICKAAGEMHGCSVEFESMGGTPALFTSKEITNEAVKICEDAGYKVMTGKNLGRGSEDFAYFSDEVISKGGQALYFALPTEATAANHSENFDFDEEVLERGVDIFLQLIKKINGVR